MVSDADREVFQRCIWPHAAAALRTARLLFRDPAAAEDLAQETMLKAVRFIGRFQEGTDGKAWLLTILRRTRVDMLRKARREHCFHLDDLAAEPEARAQGKAVNGDRTAQGLLDDFADREVIEALQSLPEEICWTLLLTDVEGLGHGVAAEVLGVPVGTVKSRAHRGRAMLRAVLLPVALDRRLIGRGDQPATPKK